MIFFVKFIDAFAFVFQNSLIKRMLQSITEKEINTLKQFKQT